MDDEFEEAVNDDGLNIARRMSTDGEPVAARRSEEFGLPRHASHELSADAGARGASITAAYCPSLNDDLRQTSRADASTNRSAGEVTIRVDNLPGLRLSAADAYRYVGPADIEARIREIQSELAQMSSRQSSTPRPAYGGELDDVRQQEITPKRRQPAVPRLQRQQLSADTDFGNHNSHYTAPDFRCAESIRREFEASARPRQPEQRNQRAQNDSDRRQDFLDNAHDPRRANDVHFEANNGAQSYYVEPQTHRAMNYDNRQPVGRSTDRNDDGNADGVATTSRSRETVDRRDCRKFIKPEKFSGSTSLATFLEQFCSCAAYNRWDETDKAAYLRASLNGEAGQLLWVGGRLFGASYDEIVSKLKQRFGEENQEERYETELRCRTRRENETLQELAQDIRRLTTLAYPNDSGRTIDRLAKGAFIEALGDDDLEMKLREKELHDLDAALRAAMRLESYKKIVENKRRMEVGKCQQENNKDAGNGETKRENYRPGDRAQRRADYEQRQARRVKEQELDELERLQQQIGELTAGRQQAEEQCKQMSTRLRQTQDNRDKKEKELDRLKLLQDSRTHTSQQPQQQQSNAQRQPRDERRCYNCDTVGHIASRCPLPRRSRGNYASSQTPVAGISDVAAPTRSTASAQTHGKREVYLKLCIGNQIHKCLLDSGSDVVLIPLSIANGYDIEQVNRRLVAANGTEFNATGRVVINATVDKQPIQVDGLVSEHVAEVILGEDWLQQNKALWDHHKRKVRLNGVWHKLCAGKAAVWCRRVLLQEDIVIQPRTEVDLPTKVVFRDLTTAKQPSQSVWITERDSKQIAQGLLVSRTVIPAREADVPVRVLNITDNPITVRAGTVVANLQPGTLLDDSQSPSTEQAENAPIEEIVDHVDSSVPDACRQCLRELLMKYRIAFSLSEHDMGRTTATMHSIDTGDGRPIRQPLRRHPPAHEDVIRQQVDDLLHQGIIEPAQSPWASNIVLVKKKDGSLRMCVDYRQVNSVTKKDAYPLPRTDACLDAMSGSVWFSTFDLRQSYHQVPLNPADSDKTAFICRRGMFRYRTMPFGLSNAGATFQRLMDVVLSGLNMFVCLVYLDDIIVYSSDLSQHLERLEMVLCRLKEAGLKLKPSKCNLMQKSVSFLGHIVSGNGVATDPCKTSLIAKWPTPTNLKNLRSFLGLSGYYRRFVKDYAKIAAPLNKLSRAGHVFEWTRQCDVAFDSLKTALISPPILAMPDDTGHYILDTDSSDTAIGAILSQVQGGHERVIAYGGRSLSRAEINYCITRKELLAMVYFMRYYRQYLLGRKFTVRTDHSAITWLRNTPDPVGQNARWLEVITEYDFDVQHRPGSSHGNADAASRHPCLTRGGCAACCPLNARLVNSQTQADVGVPGVQSLLWDNSAISAAQKVDSSFADIYEVVASGATRPDWKTVALWTIQQKVYWHQFDRLSLRDGVLCRKFESADGHQFTWQVLLPEIYRTQLISLAHTGMTGGHLGRSRTEEQVQRRAYWCGWRKDVRNELRKCAPCAQYHRGPQPHQTGLNPFPSGEPFECVSLDITGKHPKSSRGNEYILTVMDSFTKWAEAFPIRNHTAPTVARVLVQQVFSRFGTPRRILTDRGPEFESDLFKELCRWFDIDKVRTTAYQPSTNGMLERFHRTLNTMLAKVVCDNQRDWDERVPLVMSAYRGSVHETTGYSPNFLMFMHENRAPLDLVLRPPVDEQSHHTSHDDFVAAAQGRAREAYDIAREHLRRAAERRKDDYDIGVKPAKFSVGQWVWYFYPRKRIGKSAKWSRYYGGPHLVVRVITPCNYVIQKSKRSKPQVVHGDKLKLCFGQTPASWLSVDSRPAAADDADQTADCDTPVARANEQQTVPSCVASPGRRQTAVNDSHNLICDDETMIKHRFCDDDANLGSPRQRVHGSNEHNEDDSITQPINHRPRRTRRRPAHLNDYE
jgi:transposase InsO family protein